MELHAHPEPGAAWRQIKADLRRAVGDSTFEIWLSQLELGDWDGRVLRLTAPPAAQAWVSRRFGRLLERSARSVLGPSARIAFEAGAASPHQALHLGSRRDHDGLNPRYSFDQFIIGESNRLAHGAALAVAERPGQALNPLFLCAPPGLGKTHLLHAIGNYAQAFGGGATVRYTTVEAFTNDFVAALSTRATDRFKHAYRDVDVLLIDDVQFLASKAKTEEEFFHTFNALYDTGRQLVLTCDRLPEQLVGVEERLRERFESGLVTEIMPPDFDTRVAILRKRTAVDRVAVDDPAVLELIAERITDNVRALEGALIRIVANHSITDRPLDLELARSVLEDIHPQRGHGRPAAHDIQDKVAAHFGIAREEMLSATRAARIAWPRQVAIYLVRELTHTALQTIGEQFGGRNHATVLHACKRVQERVRDDPEAAAQVQQLRGVLGARQADRRC